MLDEKLRDAPAFGEKSMKLGDLLKDEPASQQAEEGAATSTAQVDATDGDEPGRVPYSRFEKAYNEAKEAREEARLAREEIARLSSEQQHFSQQATTDETLPDYWIELFGDSDASKKAFKAEEKRIAAIEARAEERAVNAYESRLKNEETVLTSNLDTVESRLDTLSEYLGRDLTEDEQSELLDIVDEFTPKNADGSYAGDLISFDKAWQIREMQGAKQSAGRNQARNAVAAASGASSQAASVASEDKDFNPMAWGSWRNRKELR